MDEPMQMPDPSHHDPQSAGPLFPSVPPMAGPPPSSPPPSSSSAPPYAPGAETASLPYYTAPDQGAPWTPAGAGAGTPPPRQGVSRLSYAIAVGAVALAAGGFFVGRAVSGGSSSGSTVAGPSSVLSAAEAAATTPSTGSAANCVPPGNGGVAGTLKTDDGTTLTVTDRNNQSVTVKASSSTKVTRISVGAVGAVVKGAWVTVHGTAGTGTPTTIAADQIAVVPAALAPAQGQGRPFGGGRGGFAVGTVSSVASGSFTVTESNGTAVTVTTSSTTKVLTTTEIGVKDLALNQTVAVRGTKNTDGSVTASAITETDPAVGNALGRGLGGFGGFGPGRGGHGGAGGPGAPQAPASTTPTTGA